MKIIVTGGAGFIGSHLADNLIKEGHKVVIIDNLSTGGKKNINTKAKFYKIDICDSHISEIFKKEKPKIVFHFTAQIDIRKSIDNPIEDAKVNILGSINILENCRRFKVKKVVFASTGGAIYGDADIVPTPESYPAIPLSPYGIAKLTIENYLNYYYKIFGLQFIVLRFANVYGPRQNSKSEAGVIAIFCDKILHGNQPTINGDGKQTRDFVYIDDAVEAIVLAMKTKKIGIFNIGTAKETDVNTIFNLIKKESGLNYKAIRAPAKKGEQERSCLDYSKAKEDLGWRPKYNLEKGIRETIEWYKSLR